MKRTNLKGFQILTHLGCKSYRSPNPWLLGRFGQVAHENAADFVSHPRMFKPGMPVGSEMIRDNATAIAAELMLEFARRTGLHPASRNTQRYLWTDAFAVCNFLELFARTNNELYRTCAMDLVDQVHQVLGHYRADDYRHGWISGLGEDPGKRHPTVGGLRIGKPLKERGAGEPIDERLEWDRDGQYFHYLTKWMHALCRAAIVSDHPAHAEEALELGEAAFRGFAGKSASGNLIGIYWKMSTDLSRPLTFAMGLHDALDGLVTFREVQDVIAKTHPKTSDSDLTGAITSLSNLCRSRDWGTSDPLGIGSLLFDACRLSQLPQRHGDDRLLKEITNAFENGVTALLAGQLLTRPASQRLAFRELGLAIGLKAIPTIVELNKNARKIGPHLPEILQSQYQSLAEEIISAWLPCAQTADQLWQAHQDINDVMLATALIPDTFLSVDERIPLKAF